VQLQRQRQLEEERLRKQRLEQEAVARILTQKWEEEDRRRSKRKRRGEQEGREDSEDDDRKARHARRFKEEGQDADGSRSGAEPDTAERSTEPRAERGEWVSVGRGGAGEAFEPAPASLAGQRRGALPEPAEGEWRSSEPPHERVGLPPEPHGRACEEEGATVAAAALAREARGRHAEAAAGRAAAAAGGGQRGRSAVPGVFGLSDSEEEAAGMKREMERAARSRRQRMSLHAEAQARAAEAHRAPTGARGSAAPAAGTTSARAPPDLCTQLMKVAEWKRSCGGKRLPMPEEMKLEVAKAMGAAV